jgi:ABC-type dipeptide/oligopeptide/nickel transport system ATPase subunit
VNIRGVVTTADARKLSLWAEREITWVLENRWTQLSRNTGGKAPDVDWVGVQREVELGLQRRLRRELQVEPLIICLVQPAPAGTPAYKGRADAEPDNRPAPRGRREVGREGPREAGRELSRELVRDPARVAAALDKVGLSGFATRPVGALSAGQFQRVMFARLMLQDAKLLLLDEPTAAVDTRTEADLVAQIRAWHAEGRTVVVVLHDLDLVRALCPQALLLAGSKVAWGATEQVLTAENRLHARLLAEAQTGPERRKAA